MPRGWEKTWLKQGGPGSLPSSNGTADERSPVGGGRQAGRGDGGRSAMDAAAAFSAPLPVAVFMSSMAGDRKVTKDSRWAIDFFRNKRVPFEVVDLATRPDERTRMAMLSGEDPVSLPQIHLGSQCITLDRIRDLEDHAELDPLLRAAVRQFAASRA